MSFTDPDDYVTGEQDARRRQATRSLFLAGERSPEATAAARRAAARLGLSETLATNDPALIAEAERADRTEALANAGPATTEFIANETNAALAQDQVRELSVMESLLRGVGSRAVNMAGNLGRGLFTAVDAPADFMARQTERIGLPSTVEIRNGRVIFGRQTAADRASRFGTADTERLVERGENVTLGYSPMTSWEEVKTKPVQSVIPFALEQGIVSLPDMVAAVTALPAYVASRTGAIGQRRAENDQRSDATVGDLVTALPAAAASALLERLGTRGIIGLDDAARTVGQIPGAIGRAGLREAGTEAAQSAVENTGETLGTERGFSPAEAAEVALQGAVAGGPFGAAVRTVTAPVQVAMQRGQDARTAQANAQSIEDIGQAVGENPLLERAPDRLREFIRGASPDGNVYVPAEQAVTFFQADPARAALMDEWDIRDQVEQAAVSGADIAIPSDVYFTQVYPSEAHGAWSDYVRLSEGGVSLSEARAAEQEGDLDLAEAVSRAADETRAALDAVAPSDRVRDETFQMLRQAGRAEPVARQEASLVAERYAARAAAAPDAYADAYAAFRADGGVRVERGLPEGIRQSDRLDRIIAAMQAPPRPQGATLLEMISKSGGVFDVGGDLASMDAGAWSNPRLSGRPGRRRLIRPEGAEPGAFGMDDALTRAIDEGYLPDGADATALLDAVRRELSGSPVLNTVPSETDQDVATLRDLLEERGIDPASPAASIRDTLMQEPDFSQGPRGGYTRGDQAIITLFQKADQSTFVHEAGHLWLDEMVIDASRSQAVKADLDTVLAWFSKEAGETITADKIGVDQHELWARGFERFLMEGVAPSLDLRSPFSRFAAWLGRIYKTVERLNAPITDDIRAVMSRLVASQDQLALAKETQALNRHFATPEAGKMTKAEFAAYTAKDRAANEVAQARMLKRIMEPLRKREGAAYRSEREAFRGEAAMAVDAMPDIAAMARLRETGEKLDQQAIAEIMGDRSGIALLPRGTTAKGGAAHPDVLAEIVGASSGRALLDALVQHEAERQQRRDRNDKRPVRDARIEERMDNLAAFLLDDPMRDGRLEEQAMASLHEAERSATNLTELNAYARFTDTRSLWTREGIEAYAREQIAGLRVTRLRPSLYLRAERSAGIQAQRHLLAGKHKDALDAKLRQTLNFELYREVVRVQEAVEKADALFNKIITAKDKTTAKARNFDMVNAARSILAAYGLARRGGEPVAQYMTALEAYDPAAHQALRDTVEAATAGARPLGELTTREFLELSESIGQLWAMSRETQVMEIDGRRIELAVARDEMRADLLTNIGPQPEMAGIKSAVTRKEQAGRFLLSVRNLLGKVEEWATLKGPAFSRYVWKPVSDAADQYRTLEREHMPTLETAMRTLIPDTTRTGKIEAAEIGYTFGASSVPPVVEIVGAMRHLGNPSNYRKLLLGRDWGTQDADGNLNDQAFQAMLRRLHAEGVIQKRHWDYVQAEWDLHDTIKPLAQRAHRRMTGRYFEEITAQPINTPFGTYAGGYVSAKADPNVSPRAAEFAATEAIGQVARGRQPGTASGFTKSRVEYNAPLNLDPARAVSEFGEALRLATLGPAVQDVSRLLQEKEFAATLNAYDFGAWNQFLAPWLERAAAQRVARPPQDNLVGHAERFMNVVTQRTGAAIMMANVLNATQQLTGFAPAMQRAGAANMASATRLVLADRAAVVERMETLSPMMVNRRSMVMRDLTDAARGITINPGPIRKVADWTARHSYFLQRAVQNFMDPIVWTAAYNRATQDRADDPVAYADSVVRATQDSYAPETSAKFASVLPPFLTQFTGYFVGQANLVVTEGVQASRAETATARAAAMARLYILLIAVPAIGAELIGQAFRGTIGDEDEDGWADDLGDIFLMSQLRYVLAFVPVAGQFANAAINQFDDKFYNDRLQFSPAISTIDGATRGVKGLVDLSAGEGDVSRTTKDMATTAMIATGVPTFPRQLGYVVDVAEGDVEPTDPLDAARGLVSGVASEDSRKD